MSGRFPGKRDILRVLSRQCILNGSAGQSYPAVFLCPNVGGELSPSPALTRGKSLLVAVVAVQRRASKISDPHIGGAVRSEAEQLSRAARKIDDPIARVRAAVVNPDHDSPSV